jgi:undecaprenyl-diphosphatase
MTAVVPVSAPEEDRARASVARPLLIGGAISAVLFAGFLALVASLGSPAVVAFDARVFAAMQAWHSPPMTAFVLRLTDFGDTVLVVTICAAALAFVLYRRQWASAVLILAVLALGRLLGTVAQNAVRRVRPPQSGALITLPGTYALPSGHSITAMLLYGVLGFLLWRGLRMMWQRVLAVAVCAALIASIGLTRIYLGVHWPTDVLAGWLLGGAWLSLLAGGYVAWERRESARSLPSARPQSPPGS